MFKKIEVVLKNLVAGDDLERDQGRVQLIDLGKSPQNWTGWFKDAEANLIPIFIFTETKFKEFHFKTSRMSLSYEQDVNIKVSHNDNIVLSGLTLYGSNLSNEEFSIVAGTLNSLIYDKNVDSKDLENLMLLLERAVGRSKTISHEAITGFWGELLVIDLAKDTKKFILGWAKDSNSIFDFTFEDYPDIEVKTSVGNERTHFLSSDQVEKNDKETIFISLHSREIDSGKLVIDIFNNINQKIDLKNSSQETSNLKNIFLNKCLDRIGDALYASNFTGDAEMAQKNLRAFYADELRIPKISKPVIKAKYHVLLNDEHTINSSNILKKIDPIFISIETNS